VAPSWISQPWPPIFSSQKPFWGIETSFFLRKEVSLEVLSMENEWMAEGKCLQTKAGNIARGERICMKCPSAIWGSPVVAGLLNSGLCTISLGERKVVKELNSIARKLTGIEIFSSKESSTADRIAVLCQILEYATETGWSLEDRSQDDTQNFLGMLIEFCERAEEKGLEIFAGW
jgi:hypothetical protein